MEFLILFLSYLTNHTRNNGLDESVRARFSHK